MKVTSFKYCVTISSSKRSSSPIEAIIAFLHILTNKSSIQVFFFQVCVSPDSWLECVVFKSWIGPHSLEVLHHGLLEEPHLVEDLCLDEDRLAGIRILLDHLRDLGESLLTQTCLSKETNLKSQNVTSSFPINCRLLLLIRNPNLSSWSKLKPSNDYELGI